MSDTLFANIALLRALKQRDYRFVTPTPATHARIIARKSRAENLRDVFGWSLPFAREVLDEDVLGAMENADLLEPTADEGVFKSRVRVSSLDDILFLHSPFPASARDAVFFGPDSYRFAAFLKRELPKLGPRRHVVDIGSGSGVGAIIASRILDDCAFSFTDINPAARDFAQANAINAPCYGESLFYVGDGLRQVAGPIDCVIANPPYVTDVAGRAYRDGGDLHGAAISLDWARQAAERLQPGGVFLLYTATAIIAGEDPFKAALGETLDGFELSYEEIDPDVFGEQLERDAYADVERIAVVGVVAVKSPGA